MAKKASRRVAVVSCRGGDRAKRKVDRSLTHGDCAQALADFPEGVFECAQACLGLGTCVAACRPGAIVINAHGVAEVDADKCVGCGLCAKRCPKGIIGMVFRENTVMPRCSNLDKGAVTKGLCEVGCVACGMCAVKCPRGIIVDSNGIFTRV